MAILVTGGAGFIGSHLCEALSNKGEEVVCFDNFSSGSMTNLTSIKDNITIVKGDANSYDDLAPVFKSHDIEGIFHYAAVVGVKRTLENPLSVLADVDGFKNVMELARLHNTKKVVFSSSSEVYGEPVEIPEVEDGHVNAKLPYAVVKLLGEKFLESYYQIHGIKTCSLRFFNAYGPRQESSDYGFVTGIFIRQVLAGQAPTVFNDGTMTRDFVYVKDNVEAGIRAMERDATNGQVINVGTGKPTTILDLASTIIRLCGKDLKPTLIPVDREDVRHRFPSVSRMIELLNYRPDTSLDTGLNLTIEWYKKSGLVTTTS